MIAFRMYLFAFLTVFSISPTQVSAQEFSSIQAIRTVFLLSAAIEHCEDSVAALNDPHAMAKIDDVNRRLEVAFIERAMKLNPRLDATKVQLSVKNWLTTQELSLYEVYPKTVICKIATPTQVTNGMSMIKKASFLDAISSYGRSDTNYDAPVLLNGQQTIKTYALRIFQNIVLSSLRTSHFKKEEKCKSLIVDAIDLSSRDIQQASNMPLFVKSPIKYVENWQVSCGTISKRFRVMFFRDSDGMKGQYSISQEKK